MPRKAATARKPDLARRKYLCRACIEPLGPYAHIAFPLRGVCANCGAVTDVAVIQIQPPPQPRLELFRPAELGEK